jgi:hypothetical protein
MQRSPLIVPGTDCKGLVAPKRTLPAATAFFPYQIIATTGPECIYLTSPAKKGLADKSL